jgi:hypothetical protein
MKGRKRHRKVTLIALIALALPADASPYWWLRISTFGPAVARSATVGHEDSNGRNINGQ